MRKKDIFIQDDISSCGARCIQSVVSYYDGYVPLETVLEDTNTTTSGTTALNLVLTLRKYGFDAFGIKLSLESIDPSKLPIIAHVVKSGYEHFLVIYDIADEYVLTMDPECGKKKYSKAEFRDIFSKNAILFTPKGEIPKFKKSKSLINTFKPLIYDQKFKIVIVVIISIIILLLNVILSFQLKIFSFNFLDPFLLSTLLIFIQILAKLFTHKKNQILLKLIKYIDEESLKRFISHIFKLPISYLHNKRIGEIVKKIEDMSFIKDLLLRLFVINSLDLLTIVILLPILFIISAKLTFIYSIILILYTIIIFFTQKIIYKNEKDTIKYYNEYSGTLVEYLEGIESIKNLNATESFIDDACSSLKNYTKINLHNNLTKDKIKLIKDTIYETGCILVLLFGFLSLSDSFSLFDLMTYESIFSLLFLSYESITSSFEYFLKGKAIFRNICEFNDVLEERCKPDYDESFKRLRIINLSFTYDHLHYILKDFNLYLKKGEKVLVCGPSGIGKSTLVKCLSGLINKYDGNIVINERNIKDMSIQSLKRYFLYIGQEETLFRKSILENVTLGDFDQENFDYVSNISLLNEVVNKRMDKEQTTLLEGASNLSGGERARLILARALYRRPDVLIIDETLSSVSEEMENIILKNLLSIENMSLIYITHRNKENLFNNIIKFRKDGTYEINRK